MAKRFPAMVAAAAAAAAAAAGTVLANSIILAKLCAIKRNANCATTAGGSYVVQKVD